MVTDPIADFLTRIRNSIKANHKKLFVPYSRIKHSIAKVLYEKGYISGCNVLNEEKLKKGGALLEIKLKYLPGFLTKESAIVKLVRMSKPGLRAYSKSKEIPSIINGLGIAILSTSKGVISDKEARAQNIGGELLCYVY